VRRRLIVSGRVQGVAYRASTAREAERRGVRGWVRNRADGSVELFAQGESDRIDRLVDWAWAGPVAARVTGVQSDVVAPDLTLTDFFIQPGPSTN